MQLRFIQEGHLKKQPISLDQLSSEDIENKSKDSIEKIIGYLPIENNEHFLIMKTNGSVWFAYCLQVQLEHEQEEVLKLIALENTFLKLDTRDVDFNSPEQKSSKVAMNSIFNVSYYCAATHPTEHCKVSISQESKKDSTLNESAWYIYGPHFLLVDMRAIKKIENSEIFTKMTEVLEYLMPSKSTSIVNRDTLQENILKIPEIKDEEEEMVLFRLFTIIRISNYCKRHDCPI